MKVFVTGSSGLVGSQITTYLVQEGHTVHGLVRSDKSADKVAAIGATPIRGTHTDLELLAKEAKEADAVIHCAFNHDVFMQGPQGYVQACVEDQAAIKAIGDALEGTGKTFITSTGTLGLNGTTEKDTKDPEGQLRTKSDILTLSYVDKDVRALLVRLPPVVHGNGSEHPFVTSQIAAAKKHGVTAYLGDGSTVWPACHVVDAARVYVLALDPKTCPPGSALHAVREEGVPHLEISKFIANKLGQETKSIPHEEAMGFFGPASMFLQMGGRITTDFTREWTGFNPTGPTLFESMDKFTCY